MVGLDPLKPVAHAGTNQNPNDLQRKIVIGGQVWKARYKLRMWAALLGYFLPPSLQPFQRSAVGSARAMGDLGRLIPRATELPGSPSKLS